MTHIDLCSRSKAARCSPFKIDDTSLLQLTQVSGTQRLLDDIKGQGVTILAGDLELHQKCTDTGKHYASSPIKSDAWCEQTQIV